MRRGSRGPYRSRGVSNQTKRQVAQMALAAKRRGETIESFAQSLSGSPYAPSVRILQEHVCLLERGDTLLQDEKVTGRPALVSEEQWDVLCGFILTHPKEVDLLTAQKKLKDMFGIDVSNATMSYHLARKGMSSQLSGKRPHEKEVSPEEYARGYFDWLKAAHDSGFFNTKRHNIGCIDFMTNKRSGERTKTYNLRGGKQKKTVGAKFQYTDNYLVCLWANGINYTPALMFTHNPAFNGGRREEEVKQWCLELGIARNRIYYEKLKKQYCNEKHTQVKAWCDEYQDTLGTARVMRDNGNSFKKRSHSIMADYVAKEVAFPSLQHGELSTCDNKFNAIVKAKWRKRRTNKDEAYDALLLLHLCDQVSKSTIVKMFNHNFFMGGRKLSLTAVHDQLTHKKNSAKKKRRLSEKYLPAIRSFELQNE